MNGNQQPTTKQALKQLGSELAQAGKILHKEKAFSKLGKGIMNFNKLSHKDKEFVASSVTLTLLTIGLMVGSIWVVFN